jgi:hypothetical protein
MKTNVEKEKVQKCAVICDDKNMTTISNIKMKIMLYLNSDL